MNGARATWGGRGGHICKESSAVINAGMISGDAQIKPSLCPGMQYDLENEKRWMNVERHSHSGGTALSPSCVVDIPEGDLEKRR